MANDPHIILAAISATSSLLGACYGVLAITEERLVSRLMRSAMSGAFVAGGAFVAFLYFTTGA